MRWIRVTEELPPEYKVVLAKEESKEGCRNIDYLCVVNGRWCFPPGGYHGYLPAAYAPTHWLNKEPEDCCCYYTFPRTEE